MTALFDMPAAPGPGAVRIGAIAVAQIADRTACLRVPLSNRRPHFCLLYVTHGDHRMHYEVCWPGDHQRISLDAVWPNDGLHEPAIEEAARVGLKALLAEDKAAAAQRRERPAPRCRAKPSVTFPRSNGGPKNLRRQH